MVRGGQRHREHNRMTLQRGELGSTGAGGRNAPGRHAATPQALHPSCGLKTAPDALVKTLRQGQRLKVLQQLLDAAGAEDDG